VVTTITIKAGAQPSLAVNLGGLRMPNPVTVASGTFGSGREYAALWSACLTQPSTWGSQPGDEVVSPDGLRTAPSPNIKTAYADGSAVLQPPSAPASQPPSRPIPSQPLARLGAITTKGVSLQPWPGNPTPRIAEVASGMLNSIGLQNKGVEAFCADDLAWLAGQGVLVIVNVCGHTVDEYLQVVQRLEREAVVSAYELNISCPNLDCGGLAFGTDPALAAEVVRACRAATKRPLIVKLSPNVTDITEIARAVEAAGADALSLINTVTGMAINIQTRRPELARGFGGLSGPAIKPIALYAVHRCYRAVGIPILGMGGIASANDAIEFFLAGATAIAVGSANFSEPLCALRLTDGIAQYCATQGVSDIQELIGGLKL
jgi:dihydroorotate dehydrogenase (NAD+) catalytic subunit